jgi:hypothetical protein
MELVLLVLSATSAVSANVCRFAMGGIFTTNVDAEDETPPIANVLLAVVVLFPLIFNFSSKNVKCF